MGKQFTLYSSEAYSNLCQPSKMKFFVKIVNDIESLTIFAKVHLWFLTRYTLNTSLLSNS